MAPLFFVLIFEEYLKIFLLCDYVSYQRKGGKPDGKT